MRSSNGFARPGRRRRPSRPPRPPPAVRAAGAMRYSSTAAAEPAALSRASGIPLDHAQVIAGAEHVHRDSGHPASVRRRPVQRSGRRWRRPDKAARSPFPAGCSLQASSPTDTLAILSPSAAHRVHLRCGASQHRAPASRQCGEAAGRRCAGPTVGQSSTEQGWIPSNLSNRKCPPGPAVRRVVGNGDCRRSCSLPTLRLTTWPAYPPPYCRGRAYETADARRPRRPAACRCPQPEPDGNSTTKVIRQGPSPPPAWEHQGKLGSEPLRKHRYPNNDLHGLGIALGDADGGVLTGLRVGVQSQIHSSWEAAADRLALLRGAMVVEATTWCCSNP